MSDQPTASEDDDVDGPDVPTAAPPDPFANLPKPREGVEYRVPDVAPEPSPDERDVAPDVREP